MKYRFMRFPNGKTKALTLSYDDGAVHDRKMVEILNRHNIKCTFNLISDNLKNPADGALTVEAVQKLMLENGHEVAIHTAHHAAPGMSTVLDGINNVLECRQFFEKAFGRIIRGMAYPDSGITVFQNGATLEDVKAYLRSLGVVYSRTLGADNNRFFIPTDWYEWMPTCHHTNPKTLEWLEEFKAIDVDKKYCASRYPLLFYMWGHSFEFENNQNWDLLEHFCAEAGGRDDIWYATNIEIYDYVTAYRSLVFSADSTLVYNPNLTTVWFNVDGKDFSVKPGETLKIC